ncbi:MAG: hypothetical protein HC819_09025 [Cyclobacteriaceae bacterium]|nr:hypothetical protein [Cyclobacteriaceae bacterium]
MSPQSWNGWWDADVLVYFLDHLEKNYRVDKDRVYFTGLSAGGIGTWGFCTKYPERVAAMVAIAGSGEGLKNPCNLSDVPVWAFHGDADGTVSPYGSINAVNNLNKCTPKPDPKAKLTIYPGVGHNSWDRTYDGSGMGKESKSYDPFDISIYDWFLQYSKKKYR